MKSETSSESPYLLALNQSFNLFGHKKLGILNRLGLRPSDIWRMDIKNLSRKIPDVRFLGALEAARDADPQGIAEALKKKRIRYVSILDGAYPNLLREIASPPVILYYLGNINLASEESVAIVGNRKVTDYGRSVTEEFAGKLSSCKLIIISGLALGVDTIAHQTTLDCGGKTIAVLGNGLDKIYPATNRSLAIKILKTGGLIISEYPPGTPSLKQNFPARNRIIAGLSRAIIVTEGSLKSGALITARDGLEQNKDIFAVPGSVLLPSSSGTNQLIKMGANVLTSAEDFIEYYQIEKTEKKKIQPEGKIEAEIFTVLEKGPTHVDEIIKTSGENSQEINSTLTLMEIKGKVRNLGGSNYILNK